jgi:signal transduction histidine kinase
VEQYIANVAALTSELQQHIAQSNVSEALRQSDVNLNFYALSASRYAKLFAESVALVEQLAAENTGLQAQLAHHASVLSLALKRRGNPRASELYLIMRAFEHEYWFTRKRPAMQSAFNAAFLLRQSIEDMTHPEEVQTVSILDALHTYLDIAERILQVDVEIRSKTNEFDLHLKAIEPISEELVLLAEQEVEFARQRIQSISRLAIIVLVLIAIIGLFTAGMVAWILNRTITHNILTLTAAAKELQAGHLRVSTPISGHDELGQLAHTFNAMSARIYALVSNLEEAVAERTKEFVQANRQLQAEIGERRLAEEKIQELNADLENRVEHRTAELEVANRELRNFAYVVSHDLKAPLRGISRLAAWMVEDYAEAIDDEGKNMADLLIGRVKRMDNLIEGILQYSRIGRINGGIEKVPLHDLVRDVIESFGPLEHVQIKVQDELPAVFGDRIRLIQVFQNLLDNSIKFLNSPDGQIIVACTEHQQDFWKFSIADNGPGIDPKYHERIFQIFQTLQPRDIFESTGIGLALVKKIIELHGGTIWVKSTVGEGSTFFFTLPKESSEELLP